MQPKFERRLLMAGLAGYFLLAGLPAASRLDAQQAAPAVAVKVDFTRDVQPIFQQSCVSCHGPEKQKGGLRLDDRTAALRGGLSGKLLLPGNSRDSLLMQRVLGQNEEAQMPFKADPLPPEKIALLRAWIDQGAVWPDSATPAATHAGATHWAYVKPVRAAPPAVKNAAWVRNPIDTFILARLEQEGLQPSPEASREALIRRVSLDLTGLPPTLAEVDAFVADKSPDAYEKVVDRLLASPHYGERWARPWLDLARYADTNGYEKDQRRTMWRYRDWVIDALNRDEPYSQFTVDQLAGDLLPDATAEQRIATGFHRNTMYNEEGGVDREEQRWITLVDRTNTTASVWLGSTLQCAQCHNHKYDPFTQKDYYQLLAFFDNSEEPTVPAPTPEEQTQRAKIEDEIKALDEKLQAPDPARDAAQAQWEQEARTAVVQWMVLSPTSAKSTGGATLIVKDDGSVLASGEAPDQDEYTVQATTTLQGVTAFRLEALPDASLPASGPGRAPNGNFVLSELSVQAVGGDGQSAPVALRDTAADFSQQDFAVAAAIDGKGDTGWAVSPQFGKAHTAVFTTAAPIGDAHPLNLTFTLRQQSIFAKHTLGHFRLSVTTAKTPLASQLPDDVRAALEVPAPQRSEAQRTRLGDYYHTLAPDSKASRDQLAELRRQLKELPVTTALVLKEKPDGATPTTDFHIRGSYLSKGERVSATVPAVLPPLPAGEPANRLTLARWLVSDDNPLTARVAVNRFWQQIFGRGLVETSEDFGTQGDRPTHPELLDWLATEFMRDGWSMKRLQRLIVTSATYRQSSRVTPQLWERDPYNKLLARGPRFRLEAEMIRDVELSAGGLLSPKIGGASVFPPQPEGVWDSPYSGERWQTSTGEDRYRRGLYTFIKRTAPYPSFATFDAPSRELCTVRRPRTNTPLQALTTLNDPAFFEAAKGLAQRMVREGGADPASRLAYGFRLCVARRPGAAELQRLVALYNQQAAHFREQPPAAQTISATAAPPATAAEMAAYTVAANLMLNLDETLTKE